jgi:hypothetical protein
MLTRHAPSSSKAFQSGARIISESLLLPGNGTDKSIYGWKVISLSLTLINFLTTKLTFSDDEIERKTVVMPNTEYSLLQKLI